MAQVQHWGVTGWSTEWSSLDQAEDDDALSGCGYGFVRVVEPGVVYREPPLVGTWFNWTESPGGRQRRYQMAWPEDEPPQVATVLDLQASLAERRATLAAGDEQLQQLDASILEAVRQVDRLHRAGGTLGFVQPDSVIFCRMRDGSLQVVFPDVGFAWDEGRGLREPKWIVEPQLDCLFEEGARRHNAASLEALQEVGRDAGKSRTKDKVSTALATAQAGDLRFLARLIAVALVGPAEVTRWCGSGRCFLAVPGRDQAPDTQAPVWDQVVTPTLLGRIGTCSELIERLESAPLSEHFLFKPPAPPPLWKKVVKRSLPGLVGAAALVGLVLIVGPIIREMMKRPDPHPLCGTIYPSDPRFEQLNAIEAARGEAQVGDLAGVGRYWGLLEGGAELPPVCLGRLRQEAADLIKTHALAIPHRLRDEPMPRGEQIELLQQAFQLAKSADEAVPGSCQRVAALLLRQLEARGEVPRGKPADPPSGGPGEPPAAAAEPAAERSPAAPSPSEPSASHEPIPPRSPAMSLSLAPQSSRVTSRFPGRGGAAFLGALAGLATAAAPAPAVAADSRVIYMVIQAEPTTTMAEVKEKFELARQATKGCNVREVLIEPIDPQTFTVLRSILQRGLGAVKEGLVGAQGQVIQPVVGMDSAWSIDLGDPFEFIESVSVTLAPNPGQPADSSGRVVDVTAPGPNPEGYSLKLHSPGRYVLSLPKGTRPRSIRFEVIREDGRDEVKKETVEQAWPSVGRAYLVTLADVVGDETQLFASLKDPAKVSNPIREIQDATKASLMVASFVEVLGNRLRIQDGRITFSFPKPQGVEAKRLWLLFPLTAERLAKEKAALATVLADEEGFKKLPDIIRQNSAKGSLVPGAEPGWVELPLEGYGFTGVCDLDLAAWRNDLAGSPGSIGDNALLVYEFENEQGTKRPVKMTEGFVVTDRITEWLPSLRAAP